MLRTDEIIALNALMFAERWGLQSALRVRWNDTTQQFWTDVALDNTEDSEVFTLETAFDITSLEDLNILLASEAEFYRNVTTLVSIGALETRDIDVTSMVKVVQGRLIGFESKSPYPYSMVTGKFVPSDDYIQSFSEEETVSGRLALEAIKIVTRIPDEEWFDALVVQHVSKKWSDTERTYVAREDTHFAVSVAAEDAYIFGCLVTVALTEENLPLFASSVEDVLLSSNHASAVKFKTSQSQWASILFCERSGEVNDSLMSTVTKRMPGEVAELLPARGMSLFV